VLKALKTLPKWKAIYSFSPKHKPAEHVKPREKVLLEVEDAFGGQIKDERTTIEKLDWSRVNGATGPIFVDGAEPGDTLVVHIIDVKVADKGFIAVVPKQGALKNKPFKAKIKVVPISGGYAYFEKDLKVKVNPMIGTIGVAPESGEFPTGTLGKHGGNMDVKEMTRKATLYLPVFVRGALFAAGDLHAVQADGEACVSAVEVAGEIILTFDVLKGKRISWPILEAGESYAVLTCGDSLDEACSLAGEVVKALMREHNWSFEEAYMFTSLAVDLKINQVVDPEKGIRAVIPKDYLSIESFCTVNA
jgi:amidase